MTTLLETRYRAVLRLLPAYYRRDREEEMVETYLWDVDQDTQDQSRPTVGEVASIAALAVRSRLGAPGAPRRYATLGSAVRLFALSAVLLQAASAVVELVLEVAWAIGRGGAGRHMVLSDFTDHGVLAGAVNAAQWFLPLLWTVAYFALLHDRRRLAGVSALIAALPTLWPLFGPLVSDTAPSDPVFAVVFALFAWLPALALCAAHHRDAPPARLPAGSPGLVFMAGCVVMGMSIVLLPAFPDLAWAPANCFVVGALGWLLWRARREEGTTSDGARPGGAPSDGARSDGVLSGGAPAGGAFALAALGLLVLVVRIVSLYPWLHVPVPGAFIGGALAQAAALALLTLALAVVGRRDLAAR
ncbi:hypothetical protein ACGFYV_03070 [Streptomyces sp. NPDC048297]|uniref:hypothetical protein n=1 Tax=Streptomyces sp. NPDC048297 TaxID=3365531 RepID=UPI0037111E04